MFLEKSAKQPDFASTPGNNAIVKRLEREIAVNETIKFHAAYRHEVWTVFVRFVRSFDYPTVPLKLANDLRKSGSL